MVGAKFLDVGEPVAVQVLVGIGRAVAIGVGRVWIGEAGDQFVEVGEAVPVGVGEIRREVPGDRLVRVHQHQHRVFSPGGIARPTGEDVARVRGRGEGCDGIEKVETGTGNAAIAASGGQEMAAGVDRELLRGVG